MTAIAHYLTVATVDGEVRGELRFDDDMPYTVQLLLPGVAPWAFGRTLLAAGLRSVASADGWTVAPLGGALAVTSRTPGMGSESRLLSRMDVVAFLNRAQRLVPLVAESERIDLDVELAALLSGGAA